MSNSSQPSSRQNNWLSTLVLAVAAALGIPTAIIAVSTHFVSEHPWLALFITLAFGVVIFIVYVMVRVWQKLESRWVDLVAESLDHGLQSLVSRYRKKYCQYLGFQHRDFDVKGLSLQGPYTLELNQVFIELSIDPTTIQQMSANPIQVPQALREGSHSIWDYLASTPLAGQHLVVIGPPGSGKTTLLKHITLALVARSKQHRQARIPHKLPIMLFLRDHAGAIHNSASKEVPDFTLIDALHDHLRRWEQPEPPVGWVKRQLVRGRCLVMFDGLDEVADPQIRGEMVNWVQTQIAAYKQNRFIVTSRPFGFRSNPLTRVAVLEVRPFTSEQVEQFIHKWYLADEIMRKQKDDAGVQMRARAEARELLQQLYNAPTLLDLTVNPLLLTMIAIVHRYGGGGKLPEKRVALYADICRVFLGKRQEARGQELELKPDQMQLVLQPLAYHMMQQGIRDITPTQAQPVIEEPLVRVSSQMSTEAFLKLVENVSGLLLERENGIYSFAHLTFQEYLTATHIREKQLGNELVSFVEHPWWQETIRLYCAMADATPIVNACLAGDRPSVPAFVLAFDCQKEARELLPEVKTRLETILNQGMEDIDPERQHIAAEVMLARRLRQMVRLKEDTFIDTSLITCAEYQLFLDEQHPQGRNLQPDHWTSYHFPSGWGQEAVLGVRPSDATAFCAWLTERDSGTWRYRLPRSGELEKAEESAGRVTRLMAGMGYWTEGDERFVWANGSSPRSDSALQERLKHSFKDDSERARKPSSDNIRSDSIVLARAFLNARERESALVTMLTSAHDLTLARERTLRTELRKAEQSVFALQKQKAEQSVFARQNRLEQAHRNTNLGDIRREVSSLQARLQEAQDRTNHLQNRQNEAQQTASTLQTNLERERKRFFLFKNKEREQGLQNQLESVQGSVNGFQVQLGIARHRESELEAQFKSARHRESELEAELKYLPSDSKGKQDLQDQLMSALQRESELKAELEHFSTRAHTIYSIYNHIRAFTHVYDFDEAYSGARARNRTLDFDRIFSVVNDSAFKNEIESAPAQMSDFALAYARGLIQNLATCNRDSAQIGIKGRDQTKADDITLALTQAQAIASELADSCSSTGGKSLASNVLYYLKYISENRSVMAGKSTLRWYIRYFSRVLANHLLYWWWKELPPATKPPLNSEQGNNSNRSVIDTYLDIYMTFAILEERIKGELSACEGILIVKERRGEDHVV